MFAGVVAAGSQIWLPWTGDPSEVAILAALNALLALLVGWSSHLRWITLGDRVDRSLRSIFAVLTAAFLIVGAAALLGAMPTTEPSWSRNGWLAIHGLAAALTVWWFPPRGRHRRWLPARGWRLATVLAAAAAIVAVGQRRPLTPATLADPAEAGLAVLFLVAALIVLLGGHDRPRRTEVLLGSSMVLIAVAHALLALPPSAAAAPPLWGFAVLALASTVPLVGGVRDHADLLASETAMARRYEVTRRRFEGLLDALPVLVVTVDEELSPRYSNRTADRLLLPEGPDATGAERWLERLSPNDQLRVRSAVASVFEGARTSWQDVVRVLDDDGMAHWLSFQARPVFDPVEDTALVELVASDVTDLQIARRTGEVRQTRLAFLANLAQTLAGETLETRLVERVFEIGQQTLPLLGVALFRPTAGNDRLTLAAAAGTPVTSSRASAAASTRGPQGDAWRAFHDGFPRQVRLADATVDELDRSRLAAGGCRYLLYLPLLAAGRPIGLAAMALATPLDLASDDIDLLTQIGFLVGGAVYLAQLVDELEGQRAVAIEASRLKSEFLANTSHELRTPLTAILGFLRLVIDGAVDDPRKQTDFLRIAHQSAETLLTIINDVLDLAKIEAGRLEVHLAPVPIRAVLADVRRMFGHQMKSRALSFEVDETPAALVAWADPDRVLQVLTNLLSNAIKFTPRGGRVAVSCRAGAERTITLQVHDSGVGLAADEVGRVFDSFYQVDGSSTRQHGGTGLGLTISRRLAELMSGFLTLASAGADQGTTATLVLQEYEPDADHSQLGGN